MVLRRTSIGGVEHEHCYDLAVLSGVTLAVDIDIPVPLAMRLEELDFKSVDVGGLSVDTKATTDLGRATLNYKF
jgi:hypothetical protein